MAIRRADRGDLKRILEIYGHAREYMAANGNPNQWEAGYPSEALICSDIDNKQLYVVEENGLIGGVFAFIVGEDETYLDIDGRWLSDSPYGTIHRIAGDEKRWTNLRREIRCADLFREKRKYSIGRLTTFFNSATTPGLAGLSERQP